MPISIDEYREPKWIKMKEGATMSRDNKEKWYKFDTDPRGWRDGFLLPGYNPNSNSVSVEKIRIDNEELQLRPR